MTLKRMTVVLVVFITGLLTLNPAIASTVTLSGEIGAVSISSAPQPSNTSTITFPITLDENTTGATITILTKQTFVIGDSVKTSTSNFTASTPKNITAQFTFGSEEHDAVPFWIYVTSSDGDLLARDLVHYSSVFGGGQLITESMMMDMKGYELLPPSPPGTNPPELSPGMSTIPPGEDPFDPPGDCDYWFYVKGTIKYEDEDGNLQPLRYVEVDVYEADGNPILDRYISRGSTDQNGQFAIWTPNCDWGTILGADIFLKIYFNTTEFTIHTGSGSHIRMTTRDNIVEDAGYSDVEYGTILVSDYDNDANVYRKCSIIHDSMVRSWQLAKINNIDPGWVTAHYAMGSNGSSDTEQNDIFIPGMDALYGTVTAHEYAHAMYYNNVGQFPTGNHNLWTPLNENLAFSEGFSWFWANAVFTSFINNDPEIHQPSNLYHHFDIEGFQPSFYLQNFFPSDMPSNGLNSEGWVAGALWDLYDIGPDNLDQNLYPVSLSDILNARYVVGVENLNELKSHFASINGQPSHSLHDLMKICANNQIDINQAPTLLYGPTGVEMDQGDSFNPFVDFSYFVSDYETPIDLIDFTLTTTPSNNPMGATLEGGELSINPDITWYGSGELGVTASDGVKQSEDQGIILLDCTPFPTPIAPTLGISAINGNHPILTWSDGNQPGIDHYVMKWQHTNFPSGTTTGYDYDATSPWTDYGLVVQRRGATSAKYWVKAVNVNNVSSNWSNYKSTSGIGGVGSAKSAVNDETIELPTNFAIHNAFPNPFNPSVTIRYDLPFEANVDIAIYNISGKQILSESRVECAGFHQYEWNSSLSYPDVNESGVYLFLLEIRGTDDEHSSQPFRKVQKITLVR